MNSFPFFTHRGAFFRLIEDDHVCMNMRAERFESRELDFVLTFLKPGDTFWDVGANFGLFTVLAAKKVGFWGSVTAFEPSPLNYHRLRENLWKNRLFFARTRRVALGKEVRKSVLFHESTQGAYSGLKVGFLPPGGPGR
jgi:predicted methyltransferase